MTLQRDGDSWMVVNHAYDGVPFSYAWADRRSGRRWACADHGHWGAKLYRSDDEGHTWEETAAPKFGGGETWEYGYPFAEPATRPATVSYIWLIAGGGDDRPRRLYAGTEPGGLFRSEDGGDSWELVRGLWDHPHRAQWFGGGRDAPGLCAIIVDPRDSRHITVGISCGGVYESRDDGASWEVRNKGLWATFLPDPEAEVGHDPHFVAACKSHPEALWMQNHCGVFRSVDGGRQWQNVSQEGGPVNFGFPIAVDERNPDVAWVVPGISDERRMAVDGALCVCRTDDGGRSWMAFRSGLPQQRAYDEVYRHALDLSGDALAFGSTTGNVYFSADRGEHWQTIGNNFPPIYSVRFL
jgi:photosystem II stability/assembly factor-like uncharacterized protein